MNDQFAISEVKAIGFHFPRAIDYVLSLFFGEVGQIVDELPLIGAIGDHEAELEAEVLDHSPSEVVTFDHFQLLDGCGANSKHHRESDCLQLEEIWSKVVLYQALGRIVFFVQVRLAFDIVNRNVHKSDVRDHISDAEAFERHLRGVV